MLLNVKNVNNISSLNLNFTLAMENLRMQHKPIEQITYYLPKMRQLISTLLISVIIC